MRPSGRSPDQMRELTFEPGFTKHAEGSCLVSFGETRVLVTASVEDKVPPFLRGKGQGWVTAEYGMLPRATHTRGNREAAKGKQSGRTQEIQRLIGRSLRAVVDRAGMGEMQITLDCDVLNADGGTRCAAITGAWVALSLAFRHLVKMNVIKTVPLTGQVAAVMRAGVFDRVQCAVDVVDRDRGVAVPHHLEFARQQFAAGADFHPVLHAAGSAKSLSSTSKRRSARRGMPKRSSPYGNGWYSPVRR